jgi:Ricin-type beta-trefoil lectin domain-like
MLVASARIGPRSRRDAAAVRIALGLLGLAATLLFGSSLAHAQVSRDAAQARAGAAVRILSPGDGRLVGRRPLRLAVRVAPKTRSFRAWLDEGEVTARFRRRGGRRVAAIRRLPGGLNHLHVMVRDRRGRTRWDHARFVLRARPARIVKLAGPRTGVLRHAPHGGVARLAFRAARAATTDVFLNGRRVRLPRPARRGTYVLLLSASDGLRHGRNVLRLYAYRDDGRYQVIRRRIRMPRTAPLAAAGRDLVGRHRRPLRLDAGRSRRGARRARLGYRWRIAQAPPGARRRVRGARRARASFVPDVAGRYVLAVTVTQRTAGRRVSRSTDLVEATALASYPPLGARLDTRAPDPQTDPQKKTPGDGLLIGRDWYSYDDAFPTAQAVVYVVDPVSLRVTETISVDPSQRPPDLTLFLEIPKLQPGSILITVGREGCCAGSHYLPNTRFSYITAYDGQALQNFGKTGTWNRNLQLGDGTGSPGQLGELTGYLQLDQSASHFRFVQPDRIAFSTAADAEPTASPADGGTYRIVSASTGDAVDVAGDPTSAGRSLVPNPPGAAGSQQWRLVRAYGGFYKLVNARSGMCIDVPAFSRQAEQVLQQFPCDPTDHNQLNQLWLPVRRTDGTYVLASANTPRISTENPQMVLDIQGSGDDARLVQAPNSGATTQRWRFSVPPGVYTITSEATDKAVEVPVYSASWGTGLVQRAPTGGANQQWRLTDGPGGTFGLQSLVSGLCMDVTGASRDPGVAIEQYGCDPNQPNQPNQLWQLDPLDDGSFALVSANTTDRKMVLSVKGGSKDDGAALVQDELDEDEPTQQWRLQRYPSPVVGGGYSITSSLTGKAIDVPTLSVGQILQQHGFNGTGAQQWQLIDAGGGIVRIRNPNTGLCMSTSERSEAGEIVLVGDQDNCSTSRFWRVVPEGDGTFALVSAREPSSVLTLEAASADDGTRLVMASDTGAPHQRWVFGGRTTTFRLGDARYVTALPPASAGFAVMAVDAAAKPLGPAPPRAFATNGGSTDGDDANQNELASTLKTFAGQTGTTVLVQSLGAPKPNRGGWNAIGDAIQALGGDRRTFLRLDGTGDYALVGCANCPPGQPTMNRVLRREVSAEVPKARLDGLLERNGESTFTAAHAGPAELDSTLADLAYRTTTPWPYTDTDSGREALDAIAVILNLTTRCGQGLGGVRSAYCVTNLRGTWADVARKVDGISYNEIDNPQYSEDFFNAVKAQLEAEMGWLDLSHGLISEIRNVFNGTGTFTQFKAEDIAGAIQKDMARPIHDRDAQGQGLEVIWALVELGAELAELSSPFLGFGATIIGLAGANDDDSNGAALGALSAKATDYARQLQNRFEAVVKNLDSIEDVIATDYGKLSMMAANAGEDWAMDTPMAGRMNGQLKAGATQSLWTKLLPTAYKLYQFSPWTPLPGSMPPPPGGYKPQQLWCGADPDSQGHWVYEGQPDAALFYPIAGVDGNGSPQKPYVQVMTPINDDNLVNNVDRVVRQPLLDLLYRPPTFTDDTPNAGFAPDEMPSRVTFDVRNYDSTELKQRMWCEYRRG